MILHRIWGGSRAEVEVVGDPDGPRRRSTRSFWEKRGVDILDVELETYVDGLAARFAEPLAAGVTPMTAVAEAARRTADRAAEPVQGPVPYAEADARFFFGRDARPRDHRREPAWRRG